MKFKIADTVSRTRSVLSERLLKLLTVFITSVILLCLEFTIIRVMGFTHWFHFVYFSITMALLGFAISGTMLAISRRLRDTQWTVLTNSSLIGLGVSTLIATNVSIAIETDTIVLIENLSRGVVWPALKVYIPIMILLTIPFVFCSLIICRTLMDFREKANFVYSVNLLGTAIGAAVFLVLIGPVGAYSLVYIMIGVTFILAYLIELSRVRSNWVHFAYLLLVGVIVIGAIWPHIFVLPMVDRSKGISEFYPDSIIETAWTPMFRVDLVSGSFLIDGDAWAGIPEINPESLESSNLRVNCFQVGAQLPFRMNPEQFRKRALVIGAGGGREVLAAYQAGFQHIDAVDIDPIRINFLKGKYAYLLSDLYNKPEVHVHIDDGRSFISRNKEPYDAIVIYNVDTAAALVTGSYNLVENYLYTVEALKKYLDALSDRGVLFISRPSWGGMTERLKMFNTAVEALISRKFDPRQHLIVITYSHKQVYGQIDFIVSKEPFSDATIASIVEFYEACGADQFHTDILYYSGYPSNKNNHRFYKLIDAALSGKVNAFYEEALTDIRPVHDNRPFFFENQRWDRIVLHPFSYRPVSRYHNWSGFLLSALTTVSAIIVFFLLVYAYFGIRPRPPITVGCMASMYFICIGVGYMFVQITLIQRLSLVLGHPIISMAVIIPTLLISMGFAGFWIRTDITESRYWSLGLLFVPTLMVLLYETFVFDHLINMANQELIVRASTVIVMLIPLGLALGTCFPLGLLSFRRLSDAVTPIAWTANGGASVIGSILAIFVSLIFGFHITMTIAWIFYLGGSAALSTVFFIKYTR